MHTIASLCAKLARARLTILLLTVITGILAPPLTDLAFGQGELAELFAPPTAGEIAATRLIWDARDTTAHDWTIETTSVMNGFEYRVASHTVGGAYRHYVGIRFPRNHVPGQRYPVLLKCHGDETGANVYDLNSMDQFLPSDCVPNDYIVVAPTYRGEPLDLGSLGYFESEGVSNVNDLDVDDAIAALDGVLRFVPEADEARVAAYGGSRGGTVACRVGVRESRVALVIALFGQYDYFLPSLQAEAENVLYRGGSTSNQVSAGLVTHVIWPWYQGTITTAEARRKMLLRSTVYFVQPYAELFPKLRLHHGALDGVIPVEQADRLNERLLELGATPPGFIYYRYPEGRHSPGTLPGLPNYVDHALCALVQRGRNPATLPVDVRPNAEPSPDGHAAPTLAEPHDARDGQP